jgi:competence protein ComEA
MNKRVRNFTTLLSTFVLGTALLAGGPAAAAQQQVASPSVLATMLAATTQLEGKINLNTASEKELTLLPGIGPAMAQKLVSYRAKHKFGDTTHVMRIKGIGRKTYDRIKPFLAVDGETTLRVVKNK